MPETAAGGEGLRQGYKAGDGNVLGARRRGKAGGREDRRDIDAE